MSQDATPLVMCAPSDTQRQRAGHLLVDGESGWNNTIGVSKSTMAFRQPNKKAAPAELGSFILVFSQQRSV